MEDPMPHPVAVISEIRVTDSLRGLGGAEWESRTRYDYAEGYHSYKTCLNRLEGDTDCSGIVSEADFDQVLQSDVWNRPVVLGHSGTVPLVHELRNKADHNRDGYVDEYDLDIVLMNWF